MTVSTNERAPTKRAYITDASQKIVEFRAGGAVVDTMTVAGISFDVLERLAVEGAVHLHLAGASIADILSGAAIPARTPPALKGAPAKTESLTVRAAVAVRANELYEIAKFHAPSRKSPAELVAMRLAAGTEARGWWDSLPDDLRAKAKRKPAVLVMLEKLRGVSASLGDLKTEPVVDPAVPEVAAADTDDQADDADNPSLDEAAD